MRPDHHWVSDPKVAPMGPSAYDVHAQSRPRLTPDT